MDEAALESQPATLEEAHYLLHLSLVVTLAHVLGRTFQIVVGVEVGAVCQGLYCSLEFEIVQIIIVEEVLDRYLAEEIVRIMLQLSLLLF